MKFGKKNLPYALIFLAIVVALFMYTTNSSLTLENFASCDLSWWQWILVVLGVVQVINILITIFVMSQQPAM